MRRVIRNPYSGVNWQAWGRHKANMHTHTDQSDGDNTVAEMIDRYHHLGYTILALSDHDSIGPGDDRNPDPPHPYPTWPWTAFGRDPEQLGMLAVGPSNEYSRPNHINGFWCDLWTQDDIDNGDWDNHGSNIPWILTEVGARGGLAQINHPGRYSRGDQFYLDLFDAFHHHMPGIEVYNQGNKYPHDIERWDRLLTAMRDAGEQWRLWGTAVDDAHNDDEHVGRDFHVYPLPELTEAALRQSMLDGAFYFVHDPAGNNDNRHIEQGQPRWWHAAPIIHSIRVTNFAIVIEGDQYDTVEWFSDDGEHVYTGEALPLSAEGLGGYVRAELRGSQDAVTNTQPFFLGAGEPLRFRSGSANRVAASFRRGGLGRTLVDVRRP